jgi:hypothetical protein
MNITLSVDEQVVQRARAAAAAMGKSLNQLVREYLASLAASGDTDDGDSPASKRRRSNGSSACGGSGWGS